VRFFAYITRQNRYSFSPLLARAGGRLIPIENLGEVQAGDAVLFSFLSPQIPEVAEALEVLPRGTLRVAGGPHASALPLHALEMGFNYVFLGEGEEEINRLLDFLEGRAEPPRCLQGKGLKGEICTGVEIELYPPFSELLPIPIEISRGCPFLCTYCQTPRLLGRKMRHRSPGKLEYWVGKLLRRGIRDIRFITPNGVAYGGKGGANPHGAIKLLALLKRKYPSSRLYFGSFPSEFRPEHVSMDFLRELRSLVHNRRVIFGAQSGSDAVLRLLKRGHRRGDVLMAAEAARKAGFIPEIDFIFGLPFDDEGESLSLMKELVLMGARIHAHYFLPLPSTPLALAEPRPLSAVFAREVEKFTGQGNLFGQWKRQREISRWLYRVNREFSGSYVGEENEGDEEKNYAGGPAGQSGGKDV